MNTERSLNIDRTLVTIAESLRTITADTSFIRAQIQEHGAEIESIKRLCGERHKRISKDFDALRAGDQDQRAFITRARQTWVVVSVIIATTAAIASVVMNIMRHS